MNHLSAVETVRRAFVLTKSNLAQLLPIALVFAAPQLVANFGDLHPFDDYTPPIVLIATLFGWITTALLSGALAHFLFQRIRGQETAIDESLRRVAPRVPAMLWSLVVATVAMIGAMLCFIIPGMMLAVALTIFYPVVVIERVSGLKAIKRSWELARGQKWNILAASFLASIPVFGVMVTGGISLAVAGTLAGAAMDDNSGFLLGYWAMMVASTAMMVLWTPFYAALTAVIYHDLRVIKEGGQDFPHAGQV